MEILKHYIIHVETAAMIPYYDDFGKLMTIVFEKEAYFVVDMSPYALMDFNLRYYGSSMRGAKDGVKSILGNISMPPIAINEALGIYWLSSESPSSSDSIWFALHFIIKPIEDNNGKTAVMLTNGLNIEVGVKCSSMEKRIHNACVLKFRKEERTKQMLEKQKSGEKLSIKKTIQQRNYEIIRIGEGE